MLGAAWIAGEAVLPAVAASANGRLVAIASRDRARAQKMAQPYAGLRVLDSYDALLADPSVDAVYIPLVNSLHKHWTLRAMEAGKHVLCEKPLALNATEAEAMATAAASSGRLLMEAFMYRFQPRIVAFLASLSEPLYVQASFGFRLHDPVNYRLRPELGGGALLDVGCYVVSVARWILGEPSDVFARSRVAGGVDMTTSVLMQFDSGATAALFASFESPEEQELTVVTRDAARRIERPFTSRDQADPYQLMVESYARSVIDGSPAAIPLSESIANMKVLDRIRVATA
ncbi:MAG: Gfo/Idh/MocA family protein [Candidatus Dormibacteraceae bacterium]